MKPQDRNKIFISLFFLALGIGLFFFVLKNQNFKHVVDVIKTADLFWIGVVLIVSLVCHILRAIRWRMLIEANGSNPPLTHTYHSMMFGYFVNVLIPRLGELTRCAALRRKNKISFNITFGTVLMDKFLDVIVLFLIVATVFIANFNDVFQIIGEDIPHHFGGGGEKSGNGKYFILGGIALLFILYLIFKKQLQKSQNRLNAFARQVMRGAVSIKKVEQKTQLFVLTILIWVCYFLMSYLCFFALEETKDFTPWIAFSLLAFGGIARAVPIPAQGMGPYHIIISAALVRLSVLPLEDQSSWDIALALATIIHGIQLIFYIGFGAISSLVILNQKVIRK